MRRLAVIFAGLLALLWVSSPVHAQQGAAAAICAVTFNDVNRNKTRDAAENTLSNVNVSLMINVSENADDDVIIANHVMDAKERQYCFNNLSSGRYTLSFGSSLIDPTTLNSFSFSVNGGDTVIREFGGAPKDQATPPVASTGLVIPLTRPIRIALAIGGALLTMLLTIGIGLILRGLYGLVARR